MSPPKIILSANVTHYSYAALAAQREGLLKRYISAFGVTGREWHIFYRILPNYWYKKLRGRNLQGLNPNLVQEVWFPELLQKGLPSLRLISQERGNWITSHLHDVLARQWVDQSTIFHFVSGVGLYSSRKAKRLGSILICDIRTEYPDFQRRILQEEYEYLGLSYTPQGILYDKKVKAEYTQADFLIVPSSYAKRTFVEVGFDAAKIFVIPYGVDLQQFYSVSSEDDFHRDIRPIQNANNIFRIIYVGSIIPRKGLPYLVKAFTALAKPDSELLIVGGVDTQMHRWLAKVIESNPQIRAIGNVPKTELFHHYQTSSVFVLPSLADSWGLVTFEAMACGLPVIVTENVGSKEAVREGIDGFIVPIRDAKAITEKLQLLYQNPGLRQRMGRAALQRVKEFSWDRYGDRLIKVYEEILNRKKGEIPPCD